jgi:flagellar biosynthesis GTPase FlhF
MFVGNFKSVADERAKKKNQKEVLKLMIQNEALKERKVKDYQNPFNPPEVPPQYKSRSERRGDTAKQEQEAIINLQSLFDFDVRGINQVMSEIRKVRNEDGLIIFNALFPQIRNRIVNQTNPNLLTPDFVSDIIREFIIRAEDTNPLTRVEGDIVSNAFDDLEVEYNVDIISDLVEKSIELGMIVDNLVDLKDLMYQMDSTIKDMKSNVSLTSVDIDELSKRILRLYKKLGVPSLGQLRKLETSKNVERDIDRINDKVNADAQAFDSVRASIIKDIREGDVEQRLKQAESNTLSSNASIQDIIANSVEEYRKQESMTEQMPEADQIEEEELSNSSSEESLSQEMMSLEVGDIAEIAKIMTEGVKYRTNEGTTLMNGDKIRKLFVKELRKLLKNNDEFEDAFVGQYRSASVMKVSLTNLSTGKEPLFENASQVLQKYVTAKEQSGLDKTINLSGYGQTKIGDDLFPALDFPEVAKRGFGIKHRQHKHNDELEAQAQLNSMPRVAFQVKKKGRPPVKIGKGIDVAIPQDTYKTFGKHLIHYPALRDDFKLSIKYPSRSKNVGKVMVVSPEYRELLMDMLERGVLSDRMYDKLVNEEKEHFNQAVKASGLMETIKLKPIDEDKKDLVERFKVLRGQFIAGNNAPTLIKELRSVILHFMEKGQIQKQDGYDLLKELSAVEK